MSDTTHNLDLPFIMPSQAQKHVTHNEALQKLDAIVQLSLNAVLAAPPATPQEGDCYAIAESATGVWTGRSGRIAVWQDGAWAYLDPRRGWRAWNAAVGRLLIHDGTIWQPLPLPDDATCQTLGIATSADSTNRLSVASPATLLNHAGGSHRLKINKSSSAETASLLFQSNWSGRAEMGLAGNDEFAIKVSDGTTWKTGLAISPAGLVRKPENPAFRAWRATATSTPASGAKTGFTQTTALAGTISLGAALSEGSNLVVPSTGLYLIFLQYVINTTTGYELSLLVNGVTEIAYGRGGNTGAIIQTGMLQALTALSAGDTLCLSHSGSAQFQHGPNRTQISGVML